MQRSSSDNPSAEDESRYEPKFLKHPSLDLLNQSGLLLITILTDTRSLGGLRNVGPSWTEETQTYIKQAS